jgi:3-oxoacyl-[acyl-carrier protein] reductase
VTGGATGIGRATSARLAAEGAAVAVNYVGDRSPADETVQGITADGGRAVALEGDVSDEAEVAALFTRATDELDGPVDLLVNNAAWRPPTDSRR